MEVGADTTSFSDPLGGYYLLQGKYTFRKPSPRPSMFITFGMAGIFERYQLRARQYENPDGSMVVWSGGAYGRLGSPLANLGFGVFREFNQRLGVRVDIQGIAGVDNDFIYFMRASGSVSIPLGRYGGKQNVSSGGPPVRRRSATRGM